MRQYLIIILLLYVSSLDAAEDEQESKTIFDSVSDLAIWFDNFFADPDYESNETATTYWRLRQSFLIRESESLESKTRLRGRVKLPNLSRKLALVFEDTDDDANAAGINDFSNSPNNQDASASLAIEYDNSHSDEFIKTQLGYRFSRDSLYVSNRFSKRFDYDNYSLKLTNKLYWYERSGFENQFRIHNEWSTNSNDLYRIVVSVLRRQESYNEEGLIYNLSPVWLTQISGESAIQVGISMDYYTRPIEQWVSQELYVSYRSDILNSGFSYEVSPFIKATEEENWSPFFGLRLSFEFKFD